MARWYDQLMVKALEWLRRRLTGLSVFGFGLSWTPESQRKSSKIEVEFRPLGKGEGENDYCHLRTNTSFNGRPSWFFRLGISNRDTRSVSDADVRIEKIEERDQNGEFKYLHFSPFFLHWSNENTDNSRTLHPDTPEFVDLVFTVQGEDRAVIFHKQKHKGAGIPSSLPPGQYKFTLKVMAPEITPVPKEVCVDFDGQWDNLRMSLE